MSTRSVLAGERSLGDNVGLDADKLQRRREIPVAAHVRNRGRARQNSPGFVFIDIDAHMQLLDISKKHERSGKRPGLGELAKPRVDLKDLSIHRSANGQAIDLRLRCVHLHCA